MRKISSYFLISLVLLNYSFLEFNHNLFPSLRRVREGTGLSCCFTDEGKEIRVITTQFPDGEFLVSLENFQDVYGASIIYSHSLNSADDFVKILLTLGTLKVYGASHINLHLSDWKPQNREDYNLLKIFSIFSDEIMIGDMSYEEKIEEFSKIKERVYIDALLYLEDRFEALAKEVGEKEGRSVSAVEVEEIGSGHWQINLPKGLKGRNVLLIHSTENSENIVELLLALLALRDAGVKTISLCNTYQGYARQDKVFNIGQGISAYIILKIVNRLVDKNIMLTGHFGEKEGMSKLGGELLFTKGGEEIVIKLPEERIYNINGFGEVAKKMVDIVIEKIGIDRFKNNPLLLLSPDDGGFLYVNEIVDEIKEYILNKYKINIEVMAGYLEKKRISGWEVIITGPVLSNLGQKPVPLDIPGGVKNAWIFILDDETSTGGTIKSAVFHLIEELGASWDNIYSGVVHGKFKIDMEEFYKRETEGKKIPPQLIVTTESLSLPKDIITVSISPLILKAIEWIEEEELVRERNFRVHSSSF